MDKIQKQEQQPTMQKVRSLLKQLSKPKQGPIDWSDIDQELFDALHTEPRQMPALPWHERLLDLLRIDLRMPALAGGAVLVVVLVSLFVFLRQPPFSSQPLESCRLIQVQGRVEVEDHTGKAGMQTWQLATHTQGIRADQSFQTRAKASIIAQFDPGTGIELHENSVFTVLEASTRRIALQLDQGTLLAKVGKRKQGQVFEVVTPNAICQVVGTLLRVDVRRIPNSTHLYTDLTVIQGTVKFMSRWDRRSSELVHAGTTAKLQNTRLHKPVPIVEPTKQANMFSALSSKLHDQTQVRGKNGLLSVVTVQPNAKVFVNQRFLGYTPLLVETSQGRYEVRVHIPGRAPIQKTVAVSPSQVVAVEVLHEQPTRRSKPLPRVTRKAPVKASNQPVLQVGIDTHELKTVLVNLPDYQQALEKMEQKQFKQAAAIFRQLERAKGLEDKDKTLILKHLANCYKVQQEWVLTAQTLEQLIKFTQAPGVRDKLCWEVITVKMNHLKDYRGAEQDLKRYLKNHPKGLWVREAFQKLGEARYLLKKYKSAAKAYEAYVHRFPQAQATPEIIYQLANIWSADLKDCSRAIPWYSRLLKDYPKNRYCEDALFWRADCLSRLGRVAEAREEYQKYLSIFPKGRWKKASTERLQEKG